MRNIGMVIEYLGTNYAGFQRQPHHRTVQGALEEGLATIVQDKISIVAAGRTDAGVHAYGQVINFRMTNPIDLERLQWSVNCILPKDIAVKKVFTVPEDFNARRAAISREYIYQIINRSYRSAFLGEISLFYPWHLNLKEMTKATKYFLTTADFSAFMRFEKDTHVNAIKTIEKLSVNEADGFITIEIRGNSFLHNMVRIIVGTILEVGTGKRKAKDIPEIIESRDRTRAGETVPPHGLILKSVNYPTNYCLLD